MIITLRLLAWALALVVAPTLSHAHEVNFTADMDCDQATTCSAPPCTGSGQGTFTLETDTGAFSYNISYEGLSAPETVAHIHGPAAPGATAGVAVGLPGGTPKVGDVTLTLSQQNDLLAELYYVNIHTGNCPGGEIRGQLLQVETPTTTTSTTVVIPSTTLTTTTTIATPTECGDMDASGVVGATDALILLQKAVGLDVPLLCPGCPDGAGSAR